MQPKGHKDEEYVTWSPSDMVEITFKEDDDFLKIKETLTGVDAHLRTPR